MFQEGIYEQLINKVVSARLNEINRDNFFISETSIDRAEAAKIFTVYLSEIIRAALDSQTGSDSLEKQVQLTNKIIQLLRDELRQNSFDGDLIETETRILSAIFKRLDARFSDFDRYLKEVTPYTRLTHSELFTGSNVGISLESEIKKEILSSDRICFLVSFIKWTGLRIFERELDEFTQRGGSLKVITTSYMGATDQKAVEYLSRLPNTEIKVSYNTDNERLHAKAYLFHRNTGFHTGYIGSSNMSRSALTSGLEWNLKVTTKEVGHIIDKFQKTFDTYWEDKDFEFFDNKRDSERLSIALRNERRPANDDPVGFFDVKPFPFQEEILEKLSVERLVHNRHRNLVVAATGTGKTIISAYDFKNFRREFPKARLLFVAHREEILKQARATFRGILHDHNFGELWVGGSQPTNYDALFASVFTFKNRLENLELSPEYFDYIVVDEVHHIAADSYRPILARFSPKVLLGLTATPERMDGGNILADFCDTIAAEIRLPEALNRRLLSPFQYFGVSDRIDLTNVSWTGGKYDRSELTRLYVQSDERAGDIINALNRYVLDPGNVRALGFCTTQEHAQFMANRFRAAGYKADYLVTNNNTDRGPIRARLERKEINYLFVVDIFSEGVDIPEIDTVLFLRPTESLTVFLQQLGRGLRLAEGKDCLTVLDFVGNSRPEYDFESKFRALIGKTTTPIQKEIEDEFPHLPIGCSIVLEKVAKDRIIQNIRSATSYSRNRLRERIVNFRHRAALPLTLKNFTEFYGIPLQAIYGRGSWKRLCVEAGVHDEFPDTNEDELVRAVSRKWLATNSDSYFRFILRLAENDFNVSIADLTAEEKAMCLMLHYDFWQDGGGFDSLQESVTSIGRNSALVSEIIEVMELLEDRTDFIEYDIDLGYEQPLKIHGRYTRDQILAAFGSSTFEIKSSNREGNAVLSGLNSELLFITLNKSEENFSPTTLYDDFAISETEFHWQTRNSVGPESVLGKNYIHHEANGRIMLLFVREKNIDEFGNAMGMVFLGRARLIEYNGSKPMNIKWKLDVPMPPYLWKEAAKMAIG
jgi:superfamily II DNA or RNA helicase